MLENTHTGSKLAAQSSENRQQSRIYLKSISSQVSIKRSAGKKNEPLKMVMVPKYDKRRMYTGDNSSID